MRRARAAPLLPGEVRVAGPQSEFSDGSLRGAAPPTVWGDFSFLSGAGRWVGRRVLALPALSPSGSCTGGPVSPLRGSNSGVVSAFEASAEILR